MTARTLEEIEALAEGATPGPWALEEQDLCPVGSVVTADGAHPIAQMQPNSTVLGSDSIAQNRMRSANGKFVAEIWRLLAIAQEQRAEIASLREEIRGWQGDHPFPG